ncbi:hypothetical protein P2B12_09155 [Xanthomonas perforans]|nr:hypothetical protein [Xanthomonas perforans]
MLGAESALLHVRPLGFTDFIASAGTAQWGQVSCARALRAAVDALPTPYIELHTDADQELEPWLHAQHAPLAVVITPHDAPRAYAMSLGIAARCLPPIHAPLRVAA